MTKLEQLREAVRLREKATEGPWEYFERGSVSGISDVFKGSDGDYNDWYKPPEKPDGLFIAACGNLDLPAILEVVEAAEWYNTCLQTENWAWCCRNTYIAGGQSASQLRRSAYRELCNALAALGKE